VRRDAAGGGPGCGGNCQKKKLKKLKMVASGEEKVGGQESVVLNKSYTSCLIPPPYAWKSCLVTGRDFSILTK
jgi:hypothetical protein